MNVDRRDDEYLVTASSQAPAGFWVANGHLSRMPADVGPEALGRAVLDALAASNTSPAPAGGQSAVAPVVAALGLRSYAAYLRGTLSVFVIVDDQDVLQVTPTRNEGARGGLAFLPERSIRVDDRSAVSLGTAVEKAMTLAT